MDIDGVSFYDTPGLEDTGELSRGLVNKIAREIINSMFIRKLFSGQTKILWVITQQDLYDSVRNTAFIQLVQTFLQIIPKLLHQKQSMGLVVTACNPHIKISHIIGRLRRCIILLGSIKSLSQVKSCIESFITAKRISLFHKPVYGQKLSSNNRKGIMAMIIKLEFSSLTVGDFPLSHESKAILSHIFQTHLQTTIKKLTTQSLASQDLTTSVEGLLSIYDKLTEVNLRTMLYNPEGDDMKLLTKQEFCQKFYTVSVNAIIDQFLLDITAYRQHVSLILAVKIKDDMSRSLNFVCDTAVRKIRATSCLKAKSCIVKDTDWSMTNILSVQTLRALSILEGRPSYTSLITYWDKALKERKTFLNLKKDGALKDAEILRQQTEIQENSQIFADRERITSTTPPKISTTSHNSGVSFAITAQYKTCVLL